MDLNKDILENPMLSINYRIWAHLGYLSIRDRRRYLTLGPSIVMEILQLSYLLFSGDDLVNITLYAYYFALHFNCMFRVFYTMIYSETFDNYLNGFCTLYNGIMNSGHQRSIDTLMEMSNLGQLFNRLNLGLGLFATFVNLGYPIIMRTGTHPYGLYLFGIDFHKSPVHELTYAYQALVSWSACLLYIPFCNIFFSSILFGIALLRILKDRLRNIAEPFTGEDVSLEPNNALIEKRFKQNIEYHKRIIRYVEELNGVVSTVFLIEIIIFGVLLCALLFLVQIVQGTNEFILGVIQIFLIIFQLFVLYYLSNELIEQSNELRFALFDCPWYCFNAKNKLTLLIMLAKMQIPLEITVGNIAPITLQTFQKILNVSYSYFTILRRSLD